MTGEDISDDAVRRNETPAERQDRNWIELLQELRVLQTGTQILTGFLLALAFQPAFADLSPAQRSFYLVLIVLSAVSAIVALAPVALHRILFRGGAKRTIVTYGHGALLVALVIVSLLLVGVVAFVFGVVVDEVASRTAAAVLGGLIVVLWIAVPIAVRFIRRRGGA
ncbi:DUF6328 family protein [Microbacterium album]|uniref:Sodium:proton antiporter n=1 Tax=Microbacterium album TaxID=2053191 RepID=A0A917IAU2_9MICO|nr:DUF6328 family protein [Microbacterium album]GGH33687.1 hypothetical protein GCM10010921_00830 [Microbacterium album]